MYYEFWSTMGLVLFLIYFNVVQPITVNGCTWSKHILLGPWVLCGNRVWCNPVMFPHNLVLMYLSLLGRLHCFFWCISTVPQCLSIDCLLVSCISWLIKTSPKVLGMPTLMLSALANNLYSNYLILVANNLIFGNRIQMR